MKKITIIYMLLLSAVTISQDGQLDLSFADNGIYNPTNLNFEGSLLDLSVDAANNIYISGNVVNSDNTKSIIVLKLLPNGTLDTSFGDNGSSRIHYNPWGFVSKNIVLDNGKIVLVGRINSNTNDILIVRLNTDGSLDTSFGANGRVTIDSGFGDDRAYTVTEYNNSLIIGGILWNQEGKSDFAVLKLNMDGSMDTSFGEGGISKLSISSKKGEIRDLVISNEGNIFACGNIYDPSMPYYNNSDIAVLKMDEHGILSSNFGNNGFLRLPESLEEQSYSIKNFENSLYIIGHNLNDDNFFNYTLIYKINKSGIIDSAFGINGKLFLGDWNGGHGSYYGGLSSVLQNNNKLILGGSYYFNTGHNDSYYRMEADGTLDPTFGENGKASFDFPSVWTTDRSLEKQFNNTFLSLCTDQNYNLFLTRHLIDQTLAVDGERVDEFIIYPNPMSEELFIKNLSGEPAKGNLYDVTGKFILNFAIDNKENSINVENLAAGIYFLKISDDENSIVKKIVVE